jgi:DNA replication protein DnaD
MARAMLEYTITILQKVSFDSKLFAKEVKKAVSRLLPNEIEELRIWLMQFIYDKPELQKSLIYLRRN